MSMLKRCVNVGHSHSCEISVLGGKGLGCGDCGMAWCRA